MSSKIPTVRQTNWYSIIPHIGVMWVVILIWQQIDSVDSFLFGAVTYLILSFSLRNLIPRDHRKGIRNNNQENFLAAIKNFEKSYVFFKKYEWIDKYRFLTLLSSSKMSYREMALANIGFCYSQIGDGIKSKAYYERTLKEFPESGLAKSALKMIESAEKNQCE